MLSSIRVLAVLLIEDRARRSHRPARFVRYIHCLAAPLRLQGVSVCLLGGAYCLDLKITQHSGVLPDPRVIGSAIGERCFGRCAGRQSGSWQVSTSSLIMQLTRLDPLCIQSGRILPRVRRPATHDGKLLLSARLVAPFGCDCPLGGRLAPKHFAWRA